MRCLGAAIGAVVVLGVVLAILGVEGLGAWADAAAPPRVDRIEPEISIGGSFSDATADADDDDIGDIEFGRTYELTVDAADYSDDDSDPAPTGVRTIKILVDDDVEQIKTRRCPHGGCTMHTEWTINTGDYKRGAHTVTIVAVDGAGNRATLYIEWLTYAYPDPLPPVTRRLSGATRIDGAAAGDRAGTATAPAGDLDYDGYGDLLVAAPRADPQGRRNAGSVYVVRGVDRGKKIDLASPKAVFVRIDGPRAGALAGSALAGIGDVNDDLIEDWVIGAPGTRTAARGTVFVVFGRETPGVIDLAHLDGQGYRITGPAGTRFGSVLSRSSGWYDRTGGDVNGDGLPDLVVGASAEHRGAGKAYVVFGKADSDPIDVRHLAQHGFAISGGGAGFRAGSSVAIPGDLNGDDLADVALSQPGGGPSTSPGRKRAGSIAVVHGSRHPARVRLTHHLPAHTGYILNGRPDDRLTAVGGIGDMNGDEESDLGYAGALSGVIYARRKHTPSLRTARDGFWATQHPRASGINGIGDFDGDRQPDIAINAPARRTVNVIFSLPKKARLGPIDAIGGHEGQRIKAPARARGFGRFVSEADDFDGDVVDDLVVTAPSTTARGRRAAGSAWILPGTPLSG